MSEMSHKWLSVASWKTTHTHTFSFSLSHHKANTSFHFLCSSTRLSHLCWLHTEIWCVPFRVKLKPAQAGKSLCWSAVHALARFLSTETSITFSVITFSDGRQGGDSHTSYSWQRCVCVCVPVDVPAPCDSMRHRSQWQWDRHQGQTVCRSITAQLHSVFVRELNACIALLLRTFPI